MSIVLYEPVCCGLEHAVVNAALATAVLAAYPGETVDFWGECEHLAGVREVLGVAGGAAVEWRSIAIPSRRLEQRERLAPEFRLVADVLRAARECRARMLIACGVSIAGLAALKTHLLLHAVRFPVVALHHSALQTIMQSRSTQALLAWGNSRSLTHVVFSENIRRSLLQKLPTLADSVVSAQLPYIFPAMTPHAHGSEEAVRFGFLGVGSERKGFRKFCDLARRVKAGCDDHGRSVEFDLVGSLGAEFRNAADSQMLVDKKNGLIVNVAATDGILPRELYLERLARIDYAVFLHEATEYTYVASGALLDAFARLIPCIAVRDPFFEGYFEAMGDIGYLCEDIDHMDALILDIATSRPVERYRMQQDSIRRGRRIFEPQAFAAVLHRIAGRGAPCRASSVSPNAYR